jgi:hypothetical protein
MFRNIIQFENAKRSSDGISGGSPPAPSVKAWVTRAQPAEPHVAKVRANSDVSAP